MAKRCLQITKYCMRIDGSRISVVFLPVLKIIIASFPLMELIIVVNGFVIQAISNNVSTRINADPSVAYQYFLS